MKFFSVRPGCIGRVAVLTAVSASPVKVCRQLAVFPCPAPRFVNNRSLRIKCLLLSFIPLYLGTERFGKRYLHVFFKILCFSLPPSKFLLVYLFSRIAAKYTVELFPHPLPYLTAMFNISHPSITLYIINFKYFG